MENSTATHQQRTASSRRNAILALVGCSLLQLPIWGLPMTFGILQEAYANSSSLDGSKSAIGVVGTTMNGTMYLSIPVISTLLDNGRWATWRRSVAIVGVVLSSLAFVATSFSTRAWHLIILQGVLAAFGSAMVYAPTTLLLDEWYKDGNRAIAYGVQLSSKNVVGTGCPFLVSGLIHATGTHNTLRIWAGIVLATDSTAEADPMDLLEAPDEAINTGMVYGLLNGSRGVGYVVGGVAGTELLRASPLKISTKWAYGTQYGPVILFTGISALVGGWATLWHAFDAVI
ncbi:hypothetical protein KC337_g9683 [Hortaea werneckii]|nr:hypothetical protein KC337_g9683 [Hortaea werneckii]